MLKIINNFLCCSRGTCKSFRSGDIIKPDNKYYDKIKNSNIYKKYFIELKIVDEKQPKEKIQDEENNLEIENKKPEENVQKRKYNKSKVKDNKDIIYDDEDF